MIEDQNTQKKYDLDERTFIFAKDVREFARTLPRDIYVIDDIKQFIRSSGSVGANYIEASEAFSKKDFLMRIKICRKEAKETCYWLKLLEITDASLSNNRDRLLQEATELMKIFGSIVSKS